MIRAYQEGMLDGFEPEDELDEEETEEEEEILE